MCNSKVPCGLRLRLMFQYRKHTFSHSSLEGVQSLLHKDYPRDPGKSKNTMRTFKWSIKAFSTLAIGESPICSLTRTSKRRLLSISWTLKGSYHISPHGRLQSPSPRTSRNIPRISRYSIHFIPIQTSSRFWKTFWILYSINHSWLLNLSVCFGDPLREMISSGGSPGHRWGIFGSRRVPEI